MSANPAGYKRENMTPVEQKEQLNRPLNKSFQQAITYSVRWSNGLKLERIGAQLDPAGGAEEREGTWETLQPAIADIITSFLPFCNNNDSRQPGAAAKWCMLLRSVLKEATLDHSILCS